MDLNDLPPLDTSVQRVEVDTYILVVDQAIERLRETMTKFSQYRNYLRSMDEPFEREAFDEEAQKFIRARHALHDFLAPR